jgi:uncharacterized protein YoxC
MAAMQQKLNDLLEECDEKISHLETLDVKWNDFSRNLSELKDWVGLAKHKLKQIMDVEISPEDRVHMTKELQGDVKTKMRRLADLEKDAECLFEDTNVDVDGLRQEVSVVKKDVEVSCR